MVLENESAYEAYTYREIVKESYKILFEIRDLGRLPVVNFAAGGQRRHEALRILPEKSPLIFISHVGVLVCLPKI